MPVKDAEAIYLLVGEVKGKLETVIEQQAEFRRASSAINVTIAAQSGATAALTSEIHTLRVAMTELDTKVTSLIASRNQGYGFITGVKFAWAALAAAGAAVSGFMGWVIGNHGQRPW